MNFFPVLISSVAKTFDLRMRSFRTSSLISALHCGYVSDCGYCILGVHHGKSLVPAFVEISVDRLLDNILHPKICSNLLTCTMRTNICFGGHCVCEHCSVEVGVTGR